MRGKGRPPDDSAVSREGLIEVTIDLLRSLPPARVTRAAVAKVAGVHPSLIGYYFGTRDNLLLAAVECLAVRMEEAANPRRPSHSQRARLAEMVRAQFRFTASIRSMHRIMLEELAQSSLPAARNAFAESNRLAITRYSELLTKGAERGEFKENIDPLLFHLAILGLSDFFTSAAPIIASLFGETVDVEELFPAYMALTERILFDGIGAIPSAKADN